MVTQRPGESTQAWRERSRLTFERYTQAQALMAKGDFAGAAALLSRILADEPGYQSASSMLARARQGLAMRAKEALDAGMKLEGNGDLPGALQEYERAKQLDPSLARADELIRDLRERMVREGNEAYARAKQYDALGRQTEAIELYQRVLKLLPPDDPKYQTAQARLKALRIGGQ